MDTILVIDFGGQYCHLISRRVRELHVYSQISSNEIKAKDIKLAKETGIEIKGIIISGSHESVYKAKPNFDKKILELGIPILGICYGHQLLAHLMGGKVEKAEKAEFGIAELFIDKRDEILHGLEAKEKVWMSHSDEVKKLPENFEILAHTKNCKIAAFKHKTKKLYGVQFHPEVIHTRKGKKIFENFLFEICKCKAEWQMEDFIDSTVKELKDGLKGKKAIIALSGGVDSSTAAALVERAIGKNLYAVFVDTGLLRKNEAEKIRSFFSSRLGENFIFIDAKERFFKALKGITDPEEKRKVIGNLFIEIFEEVAKKIKADFLVQGTIYPDRVESGIGKAAKIKSHHNVGGLPEKLKLDLVEPLQDLYKDEVREIAKKLGLPEFIVKRHPFPGPGLAIRVIGEVTPEKVEIVRKADAIVVEEIRKAKLYDKVWQAFAVLLPIRTVGVQGDSRTYGYVIAVRIVESLDGMTANFSKLSYEVLEKISTRITNEIPQVNRVVYDITHKPPATIEWE